MTKLYLLTAIIWAVIFILVIIWKPRKKKKQTIEQSYGTELINEYPYHKKKVMTLTEERFFKDLISLTKDKYYIFPQVHLASFIEVNKEITNPHTYFNKTIQKSVDYLVVNKETLEIKLAIELDDYSHNLYGRKMRDEFVNHTLSKTNIVLLRIKTDNITEVQKFLKT